MLREVEKFDGVHVAESDARKLEIGRLALSEDEDALVGDFATDVDRGVDTPAVVSQGLEEAAKELPSSHGLGAAATERIAFELELNGSMVRPLVGLFGLEKSEDGRPNDITDAVVEIDKSEAVVTVQTEDGQILWADVMVLVVDEEESVRGPLQVGRREESPLHFAQTANDLQDQLATGRGFLSFSLPGISAEFELVNFVDADLVDLLVLNAVRPDFFDGLFDGGDDIVAATDDGQFVHSPRRHAEDGKSRALEVRFLEEPSGLVVGSGQVRAGDNVVSELVHFFKDPDGEDLADRRALFAGIERERRSRESELQRSVLVISGHALVLTEIPDDPSDDILDVFGSMEEPGLVVAAENDADKPTRILHARYGLRVCPTHV